MILDTCAEESDGIISQTELQVIRSPPPPHTPIIQLSEHVPHMQISLCLLWYQLTKIFLFQIKKILWQNKILAFHDKILYSKPWIFNINSVFLVFFALLRGKHDDVYNIWSDWLISRAEWWPDGRSSAVATVAQHQSHGAGGITRTIQTRGGGRDLNEIRACWGETKHHIHEWVYLLLGGCSKQNKIDHQFHVQINFFKFIFFCRIFPISWGYWL